jgi:hypothetical protein
MKPSAIFLPPALAASRARVINRSIWTASHA